MIVDTAKNGKVRLMVYITKEQQAKIKKIKSQTGDSESSIARTIITKALSNIKL